VSDDRWVVLGAGFLGRSTAEDLAERGHDVTLVSQRPDPAPTRHPDIRLVPGGLGGGPGTLAPHLVGATTVLYAAGSARPADLEGDPAAEAAEVDAVRSVLEALAPQPTARLLFLSSGGTVYGDAHGAPVPERAPLRPHGAYARAKVAAEHLVAARPGSCTLRCGNVYGPAQQPWQSQGVVASLVAAARSGEPVPRYGSGDAVRDHLWVGDLTVAAVGLAERSALPPCVNVGSGVGTTLAQLTALVGSVVGRPVHVRPEPARPTDREGVVLDITLLRSLIDFTPTPLEEGVGALVRATEGPPG
jgi:UDP-glucose 4-epimerase